MVKIINPTDVEVSITIDDRDYTVGAKESVKVKTEADAVKWLSTHQFLIRAGVEVVVSKTDAELAKEAKDAKKAEADKVAEDAKAKEVATKKEAEAKEAEAKK